MTIEIILPLAVILFLILSTWNGYRKGFLKIALSMIAMIAAIILGSIINPYVSRFLAERTSLYETLEESTSSFIEDIKIKELEEISTRTDEIMAIDLLKLPKSIRDSLVENNNNQVYNALGINTFEQYLSAYLAGMILNCISFMISFVLIGFTIRVIFVMADIIGRIPGIKGINKLAGLAVGFLQGIIIIWILCLLVTAFAGTSYGQELLALIQKSPVLSFIYNNNYLMRWVSDFIEVLL